MNIPALGKERSDALVLFGVTGDRSEEDSSGPLRRVLEVPVASDSDVETFCALLLFI